MRSVPAALGMVVLAVGVGMIWQGTTPSSFAVYRERVATASWLGAKVPREEVIEVGWSEVMGREGTWVVVDVRSKEEYERGHAPGAISLPGNLTVSEAQGRLLGAGARRWAVYCGGSDCTDSLKAAQVLAAWRQEPVVRITEGWAGYPVTVVQGGSR